MGQGLGGLVGGRWWMGQEGLGGGEDGGGERGVVTLGRRKVGWAV